MPIRIHKPTSPGRRKSSVDAFLDITKDWPEKSLIAIRMRTGGRNNQGKLTVRHHGGGARRYIRLIDWKQDRYDVPAKVVAIEYDPARGARIALIEFEDKERRYILAPEGVGVGEVIYSYKDKGEIKNGNRMPLKHIPVGMIVHNVELNPNMGGKIVRGAGLGSQILATEGDFTQLRLPSSEIRMVAKECRASIGQVGNSDFRLIRLGKAGRMRHLGVRPRVRGKAMNPVDHPHGGGEGNQPIGLTHPKTPWGKPALGVKTRKKKWSDKFIIQRRKK